MNYLMLCCVIACYVVFTVADVSLILQKMAAKAATKRKLDTDAVSAAHAGTAVATAKAQHFGLR